LKENLKCVISQEMFLLCLF